MEPRIAPLATAYVLIMVIAGTFAARWTEPAARRFLDGRAAGGSARSEDRGKVAVRR